MRSTTARVAAASGRFEAVADGAPLDSTCAREGRVAGDRALEQLDALRKALDEIDSRELLRQGLHEVLDFVQRRLNRVAAELGRDFFGYILAAPPAALQRSAQA